MSDASKGPPELPANSSGAPSFGPQRPPASAGPASGDPARFERPGGLLSKVDGHVVIYHDPHSLQAEQYRSLRANLVARNPGGAPWAIVMTSARKGEGKSVTAVNLAACLAELPGARVCLVDLDCRSPSLAPLLGVTGKKGVTDLLDGRAKLLEVLRPTLLHGLDCIPAGAEPENPSELLGNDAFTAFIDDLKRRYSWIVLDAPPVNPFTDPCVAAARCEGAIMVVRLQTAARELVSASVDAIRNAGGKLLGTFVTGLSADVDHDDTGEYAVPGSGRRAVLGGEKAARKQERQLIKEEKATLKARKKGRNADDQHPV